MLITPLSSDRLRLRSLKEADLTCLVSLANDWHVARRLARLPHPYREEDARYFFDVVLPEEQVWAITSRESTFMGLVGLAPSQGGTELGYWLGRSFWGKGFATEAAQALRDHARDSLRLRSLCAGYFVDNPPSGMVLKKLGFEVTGEGRRYCLAERRELPFVHMRLDLR